MIETELKSNEPLFDLDVMVPPPPPQTPTPHRFLVPRRSQQTRVETPRSLPPLQQQNQQQQQQQQFQATPRFSLRSTPRASGSPAPLAPSSSVAAATPGTAIAVQPRTFLRKPRRNADRFDDDVIVSSSPPSSSGEHVGAAAEAARGDVVDDDDDDEEVIARLGGRDLIENWTSPPSFWDFADAEVEYGMNDDGDDDRDVDFESRARSLKRRRLGSIVSSEPAETDGEDKEEGVSASTPPVELDAVDTVMEEIGDLDESSPLGLPPHTESEDGLPTPNHQHSKDPDATATSAQPTFHRAPRFKQSERDSETAVRRDPLPDVFSPQGRKGRKGNAAKYVPGGLAAEVRDWLVEIEAGGSIGGGNRSVALDRIGGGGAGEDWVARITIEEVREAPGMALIRGRRDNVEADNTTPDRMGTDARPGADDFKALLAGPGRLLGLARRNEVVPGTVVGIARPTWEVELVNLGLWTVACDWVVLGVRDKT